MIAFPLNLERTFILISVRYTACMLRGESYCQRHIDFARQSHRIESPDFLGQRCNAKGVKEGLDEQLTTF